MGYQKCRQCGFIGFILYGSVWRCRCGHEMPVSAQPPDGYRKLVTPPPGANVRYEDCFPESCCEGAPAAIPMEKDDG